VAAAEEAGDVGGGEDDAGVCVLHCAKMRLGSDRRHGAGSATLSDLRC
jgi:hypothetical protein